MERDKKGRFVAGHKGMGGRPLGGMRPETYARRAAREAAEEAALETRNSVKQRLDAVQERIAPQMDKVVDKLLANALEGSENAASILLRYHSPAPTRSADMLEGVAHLADVPAEHRPGAIAAAVATGKIDVQTGKDLVQLAQAEIDAGIVGKVKTLLRKLQQGEDVIRVIDQMKRIDLADPADSVQ